MLSKQQLGAKGELRARKYLERLGYTFVAARFRTRHGEADLVMRDGEILAFIEVKTRRGYRQGVPEEAVTPRKLRHLITAAEQYCQRNRYTGLWRVDVIALEAGIIRHIKNATATY